MGGGQTFEHAAAVADERDVGSGPLDIGLAERNGEARICWYGALLTLQADRFDEQARIWIEDCRCQQTLTVARGRRDDDLHAGYVHEPGFQGLRMRCAGGQPAVHLGAHGDRRRRSPRRHEPQFGGVVDQLVRGDADEVHDHDLGDRQQSVDRGADRRADDGRLRYRGVEDAVVSVLRRESGRRAPKPRIGDVLAEQEHPVVGRHRLVQREVERLAHRHFLLVHWRLPQTG